MAIPKFESDLNIISKLSDYPSDDGLETDAFKRKFDLGPNLLKEYINNILIPALDQIVDVKALLDSILDPTLAKADMAAQAKAVGVAIHKRRADVGKVLSKAYFGDDFAIHGGDEFQAYFSGDSTITVKGGSCIMQGDLIELPPDYSVDLAIQSGLGGTYRSDLICLRVMRDADGNDDKSIAIITGTARYSGYEDPPYKVGDINSGAAVRDFPLYRVKTDGVTTSLEQLFYIGRTRKIQIPANGWEGNGPYTQSVSVPGILETDFPTYGPVLAGTVQEKLSQLEAYSYINELETKAGAVTLTCLSEKPDTDITIQLDTGRGVNSFGVDSQIDVLDLNTEASGYDTMVVVDGQTYGMRNATINSGATSKTYDFTVL